VVRQEGHVVRQLPGLDTAPEGGEGGREGGETGC
jgi:hypothetical protein